MTSLLAVDGLRKGFGGVQAVDGCSFEVAEGTITALIGPNGSGKTTVFNLVTGYVAREAGTIAFEGRPVRRPDPTRLARQGLTRTFQHARVFASLTAVENLVLASPVAWRSLGRASVSRYDHRRALSLLADFGLERHAETPAAELSFGQRKLLEMASALMGRPRLVLLDEPTAGVNPVLIEVIERHVRRLHAEGITFLIVEHDMPFVMRLCDPLIVLDRGAAIAAGPPAEVQRDPRVLDAYLGA